MTTRRLVIVATAVVLLSLAVVLLGAAAWRGSGDRPAAAPDGPAADAAERARAALAARLGVSTAQIKVQATKAHTWNDASLGLPEEGMMYAQVLTDGYIVTLSQDGQRYVYHVAGEAVKLNPNGE